MVHHPRAKRLKDSQMPHTLRLYLQVLDKKTGTIPVRSAPPNRRAKQSGRGRDYRRGWRIDLRSPAEVRTTAT
jgi:hypothetical protein